MQNNITGNWTEKAKSVSIKTEAFIDGQFVKSASGKHFDTINPATGKVIAQIAACGAEDVNLAVTAARDAFERGSWSRMAPAERKKRLVKLGDLIDANLHELAILETLDVGKPISDSLSIDIPKSAQNIRWMGEAIDKVYGEVSPVPSDIVALMLRQPIGVVGAIVPWNNPLFMTSWKIGPILAAGNSVVLKPAEQSPLTALRLAELVAEADIPEGVFNVLPGYGQTAGKALGLHMDVDGVAFTGSTQVGKLFMTYSGQSNLKRIGLECGGKSPFIIMDDADLDEAAKTAAWSILHNSGASCDAPSRVIIQRSVKDDVVERIIKILKSARIGDPLDPQTQVGSVIDETHLNRVVGYINKGREEGATAVLSGGRMDREGYYLSPTVFDNVQRDMTIAREEIFGPVMSVFEAADIDEAIKLGNDTEYGLAAGVFTNNVNNVFQATRDLMAGVVWVNSYGSADPTTAFGGFKLSGFGRDKSLHAIDKYTDVKSVWMKLKK